MLDLVVTHWVRLVSALIGGPAGLKAAEDARRAAEAMRPGTLLICRRAIACRIFRNSPNEAVTDLLRKHGRPIDLKTALRQAASGRLAGFGALIAIGVVAAMPAAAQTSQQLNWCSNGKHSPNPDQKIAACTAVIQSGRYSGKNLAIVFNNRANGYLKKGDDDRAIADYDQAHKLDPNSLVSG